MTDQIVSEQRFIVENGRMVLGNVHKHSQLALIETNVSGGGMWFINDQLNQIFFYGSSADFGGLTEEEVFAAVKKSHNLIKKKFKSVIEFYYNPKTKLKSIKDKDWKQMK